MNLKTDRWESVSSEDEAAIAEMRILLGEALTPFYDHVYNLKRWLNGWNYDLDKILPKLRKHLVYRKCLGLDRPVDQFQVNEVMAAYYPQCYFDHTTGRDETLVQILCLGKIDVVGCTSTVSAYNFMMARIFYTETCLRKIVEKERATKQPCAMTHILDCEGSTLDSSTFKCFTGIFKDLNCFLQDNFVELTDKVLVINAGNFVYTLWRLIQPFLAQRTRDKVKILSSEWKKEILEFVAPDRLPPRWGGTLEDWEDKLIIPSPIPRELYNIPTEDDTFMEMSSLQISIPRNFNVYKEIEVDKVGRRIKWYFKADAAIDFGVFYSKEKLDITKKLNVDSLEMVHPKFVILADLVPDKNELHCSKAGFYYFEFGNRNIIFSQTIKLAIKLLDQ